MENDNNNEILNNSYEKIDKSIYSLYALTEQTNFLAMNIMFEAAKLGEEGRELAEVAIEVRDYSYRVQESIIKLVNMVSKDNKSNEFGNTLNKNSDKIH